MRARLIPVCLTVMMSAWGPVDVALAQPGLTLGTDLIFYGDNTEFRNPFREGETIFGTAGRLEGILDLSDRVAVSLGVFGNRRFGSGSAFDFVRPVIALTVTGGRSTFVFGTLQTPRAVVPPGPDRTGPHGLIPPLQRETLAFERPYEAGLQWMMCAARLEQDVWLHWQRLNTPHHRERLDAGARTAWRVAGPVSWPVQAHIVHEGGQLFAGGPVRDSLAVATGIVLATPPQQAHDPLPSAAVRRSAATGGKLPLERTGGVQASLELLGLWSRDTPDRELPQGTRHGGAFFGRAAMQRAGWRVHLIAWRGDDFVKDEGDPNYLSMRRDGTRYRGVRDYAEAGLTRTFSPAPDVAVETSFRFHRIERHYEYSYRVLAVVRARVRAR